MKPLAGRKCEAIYGIEIRGRGEFLMRTQDALKMLHTIPYFEVIQANLGVICQGKRSGMKAWTAKPMFVVGTVTWNHSILWYAGAIAHDAYHAKLYREAKSAAGGTEPDADTWTGLEAEKQCLGFQKQVLAHLGAEQKTIAYIEDCEEEPTYQGANKGWRRRLDYVRRWW